jgi:hypothetical protein
LLLLPAFVAALLEGMALVCFQKAPVGALRRDGPNRGDLIARTLLRWCKIGWLGALVRCRFIDVGAKVVVVLVDVTVLLLSRHWLSRCLTPGLSEVIGGIVKAWVPAHKSLLLFED